MMVDYFTCGMFFKGFGGVSSCEFKDIYLVMVMFFNGKLRGER